MIDEEVEHCYVCLEACDTESPCECGMHVHSECLSKAQHTLPEHNCSICRSPYRTDVLHLFPKPVDVYMPKPEKKCAKTLVIAIAYFFCVYVVYGWIGKLLICLTGYRLDAPWYQFWTLEHFIAYLCTFPLLLCLLALQDR